MSHEIYNTEGIVFGSFDVGESNRFFKIFTRELGMIDATAQSIRELKSKNRYGLQDFSIINVSLVHGKEVWRITSVSPEENTFALFRNETKKFHTLNNIFCFVRRLVHGEERNEELFDLIIDGIKFLKNNNLENCDFENFELLIKIKILYNLGHFNKTGFEELLDNNLSLELLEKIKSEKEKIRKEIQKAVEETQL